MPPRPWLLSLEHLGEGRDYRARNKHWLSTWGVPALMLQTGCIQVVTDSRFPDGTLALSTLWDLDLAWLIGWVLRGLHFIICTVGRGSAASSA